jgi:hypothetical protein
MSILVDRIPDNNGVTIDGSTRKTSTWGRPVLGPDARVVVPVTVIDGSVRYSKAAEREKDSGK